MSKRFLVPLLMTACATFAAPALAAGPSQHGADASTGVTETYQIDGMVCQGCVQTVTNKLKSVSGVKAVQVSLQSRTAKITFASASAKTGYVKLSQSLNGTFKLKPVAKHETPAQH